MNYFLDSFSDKFILLNLGQGNHLTKDISFRKNQRIARTNSCNAKAWETAQWTNRNSMRINEGSR